MANHLLRLLRCAKKTKVTANVKTTAMVGYRRMDPPGSKASDILQKSARMRTQSSRVRPDDISGLDQKGSPDIEVADIEQRITSFTKQSHNIGQLITIAKNKENWRELVRVFTN